MYNNTVTQANSCESRGFRLCIWQEAPRRDEVPIPNKQVGIDLVDLKYNRYCKTNNHVFEHDNCKFIVLFLYRYIPLPFLPKRTKTHYITLSVNSLFIRNQKLSKNKCNKQKRSFGISILNYKLVFLNVYSHRYWIF